MKYEFTITLKPLMYKFTAIEQFDKTSKILKDICNPYDASIVAELTGENNVHYHGKIDLISLTARDKFLDRFRGSLIWGRKTCTQLVKENIWDSYLRKDISTTREVLGKSPILCDDLECIEVPVESVPTPKQVNLYWDTSLNKFINVTMKKDLDTKNII